MRFEILTELKMSVLVYWVVMPRWLVGRYQCFRAIYYLHLQGYFVITPWKAVISISTQRT
jgi:hypothetical protein